MRKAHDPNREHRSAPQHTCTDLFGCDDVQGTGVLRVDMTEAACSKRVADRLHPFPWGRCSIIRGPKCSHFAINCRVVHASLISYKGFVGERTL